VHWVDSCHTDRHLSLSSARSTTAILGTTMLTTLVLVRHALRVALPARFSRAPAPPKATRSAPRARGLTLSRRTLSTTRLANVISPVTPFTGRLIPVLPGTKQARASGRLPALTTSLQPRPNARKPRVRPLHPSTPKPRTKSSRTLASATLAPSSQPPPMGCGLGMTARLGTTGRR
jgi:hypothetical protein